jgi:hypothetical protein
MSQSNNYEENRKIGDYQEFLDKNEQSNNSSTKIKEPRKKEFDEENLEEKNGNIEQKGDRIIIKCKQMNYCEDIEFKTEKENKEVFPQNLNCEQNPITINKEQNKGNKKFIHKKVSDNKFNKINENKRDEDISRKRKQKRENRKKNHRKEALNKDIPNKKNEEYIEIPYEIIEEIIKDYEQPKINNNNKIQIQSFEKIKIPNYSNGPINEDDEVLTEEAIANIRCNHTRYNMRHQAMIMDETSGENLFDLNKNNRSDIGWVDLEHPTYEDL